MEKCDETYLQEIAKEINDIIDSYDVKAEVIPESLLAYVVVRNDTTLLVDYLNDGLAFLSGPQNFGLREMSIDWKGGLEWDL